MYFYSIIGHDCDITQISATVKGRNFNQYITPNQPITKGASDATELTMNAGQLCHKGEPVNSTTSFDGLDQFIDFLQPFTPCFLIAHNCKNFDCKVLINNLKHNNLLSKFRNICIGFSDSLSVFKGAEVDVYTYKAWVII